jgi:hypothetical protein
MLRDLGSRGALRKPEALLRVSVLLHPQVLRDRMGIARETRMGQEHTPSRGRNITIYFIKTLPYSSPFILINLTDIADTVCTSYGYYGRGKARKR